ncbi:MAG: DUF11 domain-containing protein [Deltaproteobacteria bacterium]|nr:DUF11 domain-containing protein [Deltaproteobacteria bacterium]
MRKYVIITLVAFLLLLAGAAHASPVINEVVFDPSGTELDGECVEIYNDSAAAIVMTNYALTNQGALSYTFPVFTLAAGDYVVVHMGAGVNTATNLYANQALARLDNTGDDLVLQNAGGTAIDYIAYGSGGAIQACPGPLSWTGDISIAGYAEGDSTALYPNGADENSGTWWIRRTGGQISQGAGNGVQPDPTVAFTNLNPTSTAACQDIRADVRITNNDSAFALYDTDVVVSLPADYYYISSSPAGTYNAGAHTVTWAVGTLAASGIQNFELHVRPACSAASGSHLSARADYRRFPSEPNPKHSTSAVNSGNITLSSPTLDLVLGEFTSGATVIWEESGQTVEYKMTVLNTGTSGTVTGVPVTFAYGAGLTLVAIKNDTSVGTSVIYTDAGNVASWTTDVIAAGGQEVFYIRCSTTACADLAATAGATWGCADDGGAPSCSLADSALVTVRCPLTFTIVETLPEGGGTYVNSCQEFTETVTLTNNDENQLDSVQAVVTIPVDYYYVSSVPAGTYNSGAHTVTFNVGSIAGFGTQALVMTLRTSCNAISMQQVMASVTYETPSQNVITPIGEHIVVRHPVVNITMEDDANPGATTILAARGDTAVFRLNVVNTGDGSLKNGADVSFTAGTGFSNILFYDSSDVLLAPQPTLSGGVYTWNSGEVAAGTTKYFKIRLLISDCVNLTNQASYTWGCADDGGAPSCTETNLSNSSITILLKTPLVSVSVPAISVAWCTGTTVTIPVTNNGTGPARNVQVNITGLDYTNLDIVTTGASNFSYVQNGAVTEFHLTSGADTDSDGTSDDIAASGSYNIVFTYSVKTGGAGCAAGGAGGGLIVQPEYVDDCDNVFTAGTALGAFAVAARPRVTIVKNGPIFASVGGTLGWSFTVTNYYTSPLTVEVVDEYPDAGDTANGWGNFVCTNPDGGTNNGDTVTFTVANGNAITIPAGGSVTKTLAFNAPTETCAGGQTYGNTATMTFTANDCNGCVILGNGSIAGASVYINNTSEEVIEDQTRIITYTNYNSNHRLVAAASGETCAVTEDGSGNVLINGGVNVSASIDFNNAVTVPNTWDNTDGSGNNISFTEHLDGGFQIPAAVNMGDSLATRLNLVITYNGNNITSQVTVTDNGGSFTLDFGGVNEATYGTPRDGYVLAISYTLYAPAGAAGSFINHHTITVPNSGGGCVSALPEDYDWGAIAAIVPSGATVGVSKRTGNASFVDKCETATFRITVGNGTPWTTYDARVELNLNTLGAGAQYTWTSGSTVTFSGFTDETGAAVAAFDPTVVGDVLRWDFGDLNSVGYIEVELTKKCSLPGTSLAATVYTNTNCTNVTDGSSYGANASSGAYAAAVFRSANMEVVLTPEIYFIKDGYPTMRFYVLNSGNGTLYNAVVPLVFGTDLDYYSHTQTLPVGTNMVSNVIDDQHVTFTFDQITPGQQAYVDFTMRAQGCTNKSVEIVDATWGCAGQTTQCQASLPLDEVADVRVADSRIIVTEHSAVPSFLDYCGSIATFTIRISDSGISEVYEAIARETLPPGLVLYGTPQYRIDQNGDGTWDAPLANFPRPGGYTSYNAGTRVITWNFMDPNNDNSEADSIITTTDGHEADADGLRHMVLKPGAQIEIQFEANIPDCAEATNYYNGSRQAQAEVFFDKPCDHANMGDPLSSSSLNMVTELPSDANVDVLVQSRNPTGAPWNGAWTNSIVRGENGQTLEWKVTLTSNGDGSAPVVTLKDILPANVTYVGWANVGAESSAGVSMNFVSGNGTAGNPLTLLLNNTNKTDDPGTTVDETTYLDDGQQVTVLITATVNSCSPVLTTNAATAEWGCCTVGGPPGSNGNNSAAVDLRTTPDGVPTISVVELPGGEFTGCLGALRMTVTNPNPDYTLYGFNVNLPVPAGYLYDSSTATLGSTFSYAGNAGRAAITLTEAEEEPNVVGATVYWRGVADTGNIPDAKAVILPGETVTIVARYRTDGATICDTGSANDPVNPYDMGALADFSAAGNGSFDDSCGTVVVSPSASVSVNPEQADVDVSALSVNSTLAKGGDTIQWTFTLTNRGDATASNLAFNLNLGDGYNLMTRVSGTAENTLAGNTATWNRGTVSLAPGASQTWVYSAQVLAAGGDLRATVTVNGYCVDLNGSDVCQYTNDQSIGYLAGAEVLKTIASVNTPASITNAPTNTTANATHGNAITYTIEARFTDDGPYTSVALTDTLPANMTYVSAVPAPDSVVGQVLTWNLGGGTINSAQTISISVIARVANATNRGDVLTNTAALSFVHHATTFNSTTHPVNLAETNSVTVIASRFRTVDLQKTAVPVGTPTPGSLVKGGDTIDYTVSARNSGNSPAYESVFVDVLPVGLRTAGLTNITVGVDTSGDRVAERNLTNGVDYNTNWVAGTGTFTVTLLSTANATIAATEALIVSYRATVDGAVGVNVILTNGARINSYTSLPSAGAANEVDRSYAATGNVVNYHHTAGPVSVGKTVANAVTPTANQATIGELVTYTLTYVVPQDSAAFDLTVSDTFPDGLTVQSAGFSYENPAGGPAITGALTITPNGDGTYSVTGTIGDVEANATTGDNTVTVTVTATVDQKYNSGTNVVRGDVFNNTGSFTWNGINDTPATTQTNSTGAAPTVTIIEPTLANLTKAVQGISTPRGTDTFYWYDGINPDPITAAGLNVVLPGDLVTYRVTVQNTDAACRAYDVVISDVIPSGMTYNSVVSVTGSIRGALALTTDYTIDTTAPNLQITVKRLDPGETLTIDYRYSVDNGLAIGRVLINSVTETDYSTLPAGNPYEALERDSTSDPAYSDLGPATAMVGVRNTSATFSVYRIFDDAGSPIAPQSVSAGEVRVGEVLRYEVEIPIWNNTAFLRGTAASSHFIFRLIFRTESPAWRARTSTTPERSPRPFRFLASPTPERPSTRTGNGVSTT